jgi:demethylmenaquinone methyltransferase/2-methoxy-6-polyprenyl-1,4-benzoquinol methylase
MYNLKQVKEVYSVLGRYPFYYKLMSFGINKLRKKAIERLDLKKGDKVLEIACGTGLNFPLLEERVGRQGLIVGVDYVKDMVNASRKLIKNKGFKNITVIKKDAAKLNLNEKFDAVLSITGISAMPDHINALKQVKKMLKKEGILVILDSKKPNNPFLNVLTNILKWSKSYDQKKDIIRDIKKMFGNVEIKERLFGSVFIAKLKNN